MPTLDERVAHIEKFLNNFYSFEPIPDPVYVQVILDESVEREGTYVKPYTYEDRTLQGLKVGDRVLAPVGTYGTLKDATVVRAGLTRSPHAGKTKVVAGVL
jgi:hypothetical protein